MHFSQIVCSQAETAKKPPGGRQSNTLNLRLSWGSISQIYIRNAPCNPFSTYPIPIPLSSPFPKTIEQDSYLSPSPLFLLFCG